MNPNLWPLLMLALGSRLLAGSAGVSDGAIAGTVLAPGGGPVAGVFVVAERSEGTPRIIRSTRTDAQGRFYLGLPVGGYILGFSANGFEVIDTAQGDENQRTALGAQVRTFVEPGATSQVPEVTLNPIPIRAAASAVVRLLDGVTGEPVPGATLIVGPAATSTDAGGTYRLRVPPALDAQSGTPQPQTVIVQADGYQPFQGSATLVPAAEQALTFTLQPRLVTLSGRVDLDPTLDPEQVRQIQVIVDGIPVAVSQGRVLDGSGLFEVLVPASTSTRTRFFDLTFALPGTTISRVTGVAAPLGGSRMLSSEVRVEAEKTEVAGQVIASDGSVPIGGRIMQAVIVELGISVPVNNGAFSLAGVPVGRPLTLQVAIQNPTTGRIEIGSTQFTAASGGGVFSVPPIITGATGGP